MINGLTFIFLDLIFCHILKTSRTIPDLVKLTNLCSAQLQVRLKTLNSSFSIQFLIWFAQYFYFQTMGEVFH
jgi:hypothetical protein